MTPANPSDLESALEATLLEIDRARSPIAEHDVASRLRGCRRTVGDEVALTNVATADLLAFDFMAHYPTGETSWGTYFGPVMVWPDGKGGVLESPGLKQVSIEAVDAWKRRAVQCAHPVLRARFSDLAWDLAPAATSTRGDVGMARLAATAYLDAAKQALYWAENAGVEYVKRALVLAKSVSDAPIETRAVDVMIALESRIAVDDQLGTWGFAFETLVLEQRRALRPEVEAALVAQLEDRLDRLSATAFAPVDLDPHAAERAAMLLVAYYHRRDSLDRARRALLRFGDAFARAATVAEPLVGAAWMQHVFEVYSSNGLIDEAAALSPVIDRLGRASRDSLKSISVTHEISKEKMDVYLATMTEGTPERVLTRMALHFVPRRDAIEQQLKELAESAPMSFMIPHAIVDDDGRTVARVGALKDDLDGNVVRLITQNMQIERIFLHLLRERLMESGVLSVSRVQAHLRGGLLFEDAHWPAISRGIDAYFAGDYMVTLHVWIPRIEGLLRVLARHLEAPLYRRPRRSGELTYRGIAELLRDERIEKALTPNVALFLRVLLTDPRGWNLRHAVCHALTPADAFGEVVATRVLQVLLLLGIIRRREDQPPIAT